MVTKNEPLLNNTSDAIAQAVSRLVSHDFMNGRHRIGLPITTNSGSLIDVSVWAEPGGTFTVTDDGSALAEVSGFGGEVRSFLAVARTRAAELGATIENGRILFIRVQPEQLRGHIIAMGGLLKSIIDEAFARHTKAAKDSLRASLFGQLDRAFGDASVSHDVTILGESTADYRVDAVAKVGSAVIIFDAFNREPTSVSSLFTKLSDISRLDSPPRLVGITRDPEAIGPKLQLITSVANVLRVDVEPAVYRRLASR